MNHLPLVVPKFPAFDRAPRRRRRQAMLVPLLLVLFALSSGPARAEPLIQTLPEDGTWVRFHVNMKIGEQASTPTWTVKSVGKKEIAGAAYRWIEMQSRQDERNEVLFKCLIAESEFGKGKNPLANAFQVYRKFGDQEPGEVQSLAIADPALALILNGPADAKQLDVKEFAELQDGRIECDVLTGKSKTEIGNSKIEMTHRLLLSDKVPFRLAGAKFEVDADLAGNKLQATVDLTLKEIGKDAKSELPSVE